MHGYELAQQVEGDDALGVIWRIERSEIYFLLGKLRERGYVTESETGQAGGPKRTIYAPTPHGRLALDAWLAALELRPRLLRTAFLAAFTCALRRDPRLAVQIIDENEQYLQGWLHSERSRAPSDEYLRFVLGVRSAQVEATVGAIDALRQFALARVAASHVGTKCCVG